MSRVVAAVVAVVASIVTAPGAHGSTTVDKPYVAAYGGAVTGCDADDGIGGACLVVDPGVTVTIAVHDQVPAPVVAYVDLDVHQVGFFCSTEPITVTVPADATRHVIGVWLGAPNAAQRPDCGPGIPTTGTVSFTI